MKSRFMSWARMPRTGAVGGFRHRMRTLNSVLCGAAVVAALILGGETTKENISDIIVEAICMPLLFIGLMRVQKVYICGGAVVLTLLLLICIIPILQLFPIPAIAWSALPGREVPQSIFQVVGVAPARLTVSLSAWATERSALFLIPPVAVYLGCLSMGPRERRNIWYLIVLAGAVCVIHEALQLADSFNSGYSGRISSEQNNEGFNVFLFHNRNHLAALLYITIPISAYLYKSIKRTSYVFEWAVYVSFNVLVIIGLAMTLSRSALGLGMLAWVLSYIILLRKHIGTPRMPRVVKIFGLLAFLAAIGVALSFGLDLIFMRLANSGASDQTRWVLNELSFTLIRMFWPIGSGLGTFERVFPLVQNTETTFPAIVNHSHNDFIELIIETGVFGVAILILFFWAAIRRASRVLDRSETVSRQEGSAAIIVCSLLLMHSLWDYPLRTSALSVVFAVACAAITLESSRRSCVEACSAVSSTHKSNPDFR